MFIDSGKNFGLYVTIVSVTTAKLTCTFHHTENYVQIKSRQFLSGRFAYVAGASQIAKGLRECQINEMWILFVNSVRYTTMRYANQKCTNFEHARMLCEKFEPA